MVADGYRCQQRGVEPAAMLVATLGVEIGGGVEFGFKIEHGVPACAGLEPYVEDVHLFAELFVAAGRAFGIPREQGRSFVFVPGVSAFFSEEIDDASVDGFVVERFTA